MPQSGRVRLLLLHLTDTLTFYCCLDKLTAEFLEQRLIDLFKPPCNRRNVFRL